MTNTIETRDDALKATLPPGPWQDEADKVTWYDEATGMACLVVRQHHGALCGYVGVEPDHPWHGHGYGDHDDIEVHGGLTYSAGCDEGGHICHVPAPGRAHDVWWFGFDCAHHLDLMPRRIDDPMVDLIDMMGTAFGIEAMAMGGGDTYRSMGYVQAEVARLAEQLAAVAS